MKLTRRELAAVLAPAAALAQTQPPGSGGTPQDPLAAAKVRIKASSDALAKRDIPMATEPAFQFRA